MLKIGLTPGAIKRNVSSRAMQSGEGALVVLQVIRDDQAVGVIELLGGLRQAQ